MTEDGGRDRNAGQGAAGRLDAESQTSLDGERPVLHGMQPVVGFQDVQAIAMACSGNKFASIVLDVLG